MNHCQNLQPQNSNQNLQEIRKLWNEWDPIGILPYENDIVDEYDFYLETTLSLLKRKATPIEIEHYLIFVIKELMGFDSAYVEQCKPNEFARKLQEWFVNRELEGNFDC
jgi:hypothetical protein